MLNVTKYGITDATGIKNFFGVMDTQDVGSTTDAGCTGGNRAEEPIAGVGAIANCADKAFAGHTH
jgi:hypothetical protein